MNHFDTYIDKESNSFKAFQEKLNPHFVEIAHTLPIEILNYIKEKIFEASSVFQNNSLQLKLVIDTNILFSEVRSLMLYNSSFLLKIVDNPFIKIFAPSQIRVELHEKIKIKFPKDNKTKGLDINNCIEKADLILSKINIDDSITNDSREKAETYLKDRDRKDIAFLALSFSLNSHGIVTNDKDFSEQNEVKIWELKQAGHLITDINKGSFSFLILGISLPIIWEVIHGLVSVIWSTFIEIVWGAINLFSNILIGGVKAISKVPPELALIFGIAAILLMLIDNVREKTGEFFEHIWSEIKDIIKKTIEFFERLWEVLKDLFEALKPFIKGSMQLFLYFMVESSNAINKLKELENSQPASLPPQPKVTSQ